MVQNNNNKTQDQHINNTIHEEYILIIKKEEFMSFVGWVGCGIQLCNYYDIINDHMTLKKKFGLDICDDDTIKFTKEDFIALDCMLICKCVDDPSLFDIILDHTLVNNEKYSYREILSVGDTDNNGWNPY